MNDQNRFEYEVSREEFEEYMSRPMTDYVRDLENDLGEQERLQNLFNDDDFNRIFNTGDVVARAASEPDRQDRK